MNKSNETIKNVNIIDVFEKANTLFLKEQKELILSNVSERSWYTPFAMCLNEEIKRYEINIKEQIAHIEYYEKGKKTKEYNVKF